jgi:plastocyanin
MRVLAATLALGAALAVPAASTAMEDGPEVSVAYAAFQPAKITALAGQAVMWHNQSPRTHTVTADDGSFDGSVFVGGMYTRSFDGPGTYTYHCTLHPEMHGEVDVYRLLLDDARASIAPGESFTVAGKAALPAGSDVAIEGDSGAGFQKVATASVGGDGSFSATVRPDAPTTYRATAGGDASPSILLNVLDRKVTAKIARHGGTVVVGTHVAPAARGQTVVLQLHLPERFGWWPVRRARLGGKSSARFVVYTRRRVRARVLLTRPDGATPLASSPVLRVQALAH